MRRALEYVKAFDGVVAQHAQEPRLRQGAQMHEGVVSAELATTPEQREVGLMYRASMPEDSGMLFVFPSEQSLSFWMRNTALPLSIAFIASDGTILNIQDMQPYDDQNFHNSAGPARYALEVNQGWFAKAGVSAFPQAVTRQMRPWTWSRRGSRKSTSPC